MKASGAKKKDRRYWYYRLVYKLLQQQQSEEVHYRRAFWQGIRCFAESFYELQFSLIEDAKSIPHPNWPFKPSKDYLNVLYFFSQTQFLLQIICFLKGGTKHAVWNAKPVPKKVLLRANFSIYAFSSFCTLHAFKHKSCGFV